MWDDLIDGAARRLTAGEPARGFTARVQSRLGQPPPARWSRASLALPAGAAAIMALMVVLPREQAADQQPPGTASRIEDRPAAGEVSVAAPPPRVAAKAAAPPGHMSPATASSNRAPEFAPDVALEAIAIGPVALAPIEVEVLAAAPSIALDAIAVEPLEILNSGQ